MEMSENNMRLDPVAAALSSQPLIEVELEEQVQDEPFSYEGYQVVRGEFFAHIYEPSITFNNCKVSVNTACINRLTSVDYIQFLVNPTERKLVLQPCTEDEKDSFRWCTEKNGKRKLVIYG